mmetsp:Transcript_122938/g.192990  ORF Transcript_122938/g.192990 Transcript_122938/m.192990 type:complete len:118 (+) Transcript_122938:71-424(+)
MCQRDMKPLAEMETACCKDLKMPQRGMRPLAEVENARFKQLETSHPTREVIRKAPAKRQKEMLSRTIKIERSQQANPSKGTVWHHEITSPNRAIKCCQALTEQYTTAELTENNAKKS